MIPSIIGVAGAWKETCQVSLASKKVFDISNKFKTLNIFFKKKVNTKIKKKTIIRKIKLHMGKGIKFIKKVNGKSFFFYFYFYIFCIISGL